MDEYQSTELQQVYREARRLAGKHATTQVLIANGARNGHLPNVPQANRAKCQRDLQKLIDGEKGTDAARVDELDPIRERVYGERLKPKAVKTLDAVGIYRRWNSAVRPNED